MAGAQMVSLLHLANITEEGVQFASPVDGSMMMLTPEHSMAIQNKLGKSALEHLLSWICPAFLHSRQLHQVMSFLHHVPRARSFYGWCRCRHHHGFGRCCVQHKHKPRKVALLDSLVMN